MNIKVTTLWICLILLLFLLFAYSMDLGIYNLFRHILGITGSYLADQLLFAAIIIVHFIRGIALKKIQVTRIDLLVLLFFLLIPFLTHSEIFLRYFYKEDFFYNLSVLRDTKASHFYKIGSYYIFYPFLPFVVVYYFFKTNIFFYNFFTLTLLSLSAFLLYKVNTIILPLKQNSIKIVALMISLLYLTAPSYLDAYLWISTGLEGGFCSSVLLAGIIYYILFLNKRDNYYFLGAFLVLLFSLKTGFARLGYLPLIYILLELLFFTKKSYKYFLIRVSLILLSIYYFLMGVGFFKNGYSGGGGFIENIYLLFAYLPHTLMPYEILTGGYSLFKRADLNHFPLIGFNFYFSLGLIIFLFFGIWILKFKDRIIARYQLFFISSALICLFFFVNLGNLGKIGDPETFDSRLSTYAVIIGHRYYQGVNILFSSALFILASLFLIKYPRGLVLSIFIFSMIFIYNVNDLKKHLNTLSRDYGAHNKAFYKGIIKFVPSSENKKILFLTNGEKWKGRIHADPIYLNAFFPLDTVILIYSKPELLKEIQKGNYDERNVYAFYLDENSLKFTNQTQEFRKEFYR